MIEDFKNKLFVSTIEAAKILKVRPHDFVNNKKILDLDKISEDQNCFSKEDLEFWKFVFELRNNGFNSAGIKKEIKLRNIRIRENQNLIEGLKLIKKWLVEIKKEI